MMLTSEHVLDLTFSQSLIVSNVLAVAKGKLVVPRGFLVDGFSLLLRRVWAVTTGVGGFPRAFLFEWLGKSS